MRETIQWLIAIMAALVTGIVWLLAGWLAPFDPESLHFLTVVSMIISPLVTGFIVGLGVYKAFKWIFNLPDVMEEEDEHANTE